MTVAGGSSRGSAIPPMARYYCAMNGAPNVVMVLTKIDDEDNCKVRSKDGVPGVGLLIQVDAVHISQAAGKPLLQV